MQSAAEILKSAIRAASSTLESIAALEPQITAACGVIVNCLTNGNKVLVCGNGGSAADAADFCTELTCRFVEDRRPYPAINLAQGGSLITATGNDYGFDEIFARQVRAFGKEGDVLIGITTSGNSKNIQRALEHARDHKLRTVALLGRNGGASAGIAEIDLLVRGTSTARIQEAHKFILHVLCEICDPQLKKKD